LAAIVRGSPLEYCHNVWCGKLDGCGYRKVKTFLKICLLVSTEYTNERDRQTNGKTYRATPQAALMHSIARQKPRENLSVVWQRSFGAFGAFLNTEALHSRHCHRAMLIKANRKPYPSFRMVGTSFNIYNFIHHHMVAKKIT